MRSAALFAMFGCLAAVVSALGREQPFDETMRSSLSWGLTFGFLGWGIGRVARLIAGEVVPKSGSSGSGAADPSDKRDERTLVGLDRRPSGGATPPPAAEPSPERETDPQEVNQA